MPPHPKGGKEGGTAGFKKLSKPLSASWSDRLKTVRLITLRHLVIFFDKVNFKKAISKQLLSETKIMHTFLLSIGVISRENIKKGSI